MTIFAGGSLNLTALVVPGLYVVVIPPSLVTLNGVPSNVIGVVGSASWGPVNQPIIVGSMAQYAQNFGPVIARKYDAGTQVATAVQQGANSFKIVRVTDTTDVAATSPGVSTCITFTALYTGSLGNSLVATIATGSKAATYKFTVQLPGGVPEVFDNIAGTGNAFWVNLAAAINSGAGVLRGPSNLIVATASSGSTAAAAATFAFSGGLDGASSVSATTIVGQDTVPRKGMYVLRNQGVSILVCADCDTSSQWTTIDGLANAEGMYAIQCGPSGDTIANAVTTKASAGLDSYSTKYMHGDWIYWNDQANAVLRLVSPQGFVAGRLANLSPQQSSLNKPLYSVVGTQKNGVLTIQSTSYSDAELSALFQAGIDVIADPAPGGTYYAVRYGHNSSSNAAINGDDYTRLTNYIAASLNAGMGLYVGQVITTTLFNNIKATLTSFLNNMLGQGQLGSLDGSIPFSVVCDTSNNPLSRTSLNYVQADVNIQYQGIAEKLIVNLTGGQTVQITRQTTQNGQIIN